jgi:hypothetical protein
VPGEYQKDNQYDHRWTRAAFEAIQNRTLHRRVVRYDGEPVAVRVYGACPHCDDHLDISLPWKAVTGAGGVLGRTVDRAITTWPVDIDCGCSLTHPGAPKGVRGCGIKFRVEVKEGRDG